MRIGFDATPLLHGERAIRRNSRNLLQHLVRIDDVHWRALYFDRKGDTQGRLGISDEVLCRYPMRMLMPAWKRIGWPSLETIAGKDMDLFYAPDLYFPPARRTPVLTTIRGIAYLAVPEHCSAEKVAPLQKAFDYSRKNADYFLAVSESTKQDLITFTDIPEDKIYVSSHGVDPVFRLVDHKAAREYVQKHFGVVREFFLFVGAISTHKNVQLLVDALHHSALNHIDLVLAGPHEQPFTNQLQAHIDDLGLTERVYLIGPVGQEGDELVYLYNAAEAFLFPTFYEGWCAPPLEAMACGTAVISTHIPSVIEVTEDAAVLLPVDDVGAWSVHMEKIIEDKQWQLALVEKGLEHVKKHTWDKSAKKLFHIMQGIIGST
jgi:glycosyltransferase involved in cell wall biosynthesis